jgi:hypothetical protein
MLYVWTLTWPVFHYINYYWPCIVIYQDLANEFGGVWNPSLQSDHSISSTVHSMKRQWNSFVFSRIWQLFYLSLLSLAWASNAEGNATDCSQRLEAWLVTVRPANTGRGNWLCSHNISNASLCPYKFSAEVVSAFTAHCTLNSTHLNVS